MFSQFSKRRYEKSRVFVVCEQTDIGKNSSNKPIFSGFSRLQNTPATPVVKDNRRKQQGYVPVIPPSIKKLKRRIAKSQPTFGFDSKERRNLSL
jgi:hypothetical protein